jgi:hypothetical protein
MAGQLWKTILPREPCNEDLFVKKLRLPQEDIKQFELNRELILLSLLLMRG